MSTDQIESPNLSDPHAASHVHVVSPLILLGVFGALLVLTVLTVLAIKVDLGQANIWIALGIAVVKAALVAMYFMHLRWDSPFNGIILIASLVFVAIFIGIAILDSKEYQPNLQPPIRVTPPVTHMGK